MHTGHLGFYADWVPEEIEKLVIAIAKTPYQIVEYPILEVIIRHNDGGREARYLALNECTVKSIEGTLVMNVEIKGQMFETFRGDGLCISTPSGSTAYNKALGGAIYILLYVPFSWRKWLLSTIVFSVQSVRR